MDRGRNALLIRNATIITMNPKREILKGDVYVEGGRIVRIGRDLKKAGAVIDGSDKVLCPGFVQTHVHLCQTLFRNLADELELLDWLRKRIWPLEAAHTERSLRVSAQLGLAELLRGGTTTILDMGSVRETDVILEAAEQAGIRASIGRTLIDDAEDMPPQLREKTSEALQGARELFRRWQGRNSRLRVHLAPRFALSCTSRLLRESADLARELGTLLHTHGSESRKEVEEVQRQTGLRNVTYYHQLGMTGRNFCLAHGIWLDDTEVEILRETGSQVLHCPSANLKLGSGIARVPEMLQRGINVSLGADGAPCNNNLDILWEMRLAGLIQKGRAGAQALPAETLFEMATLRGAKALGLESEIGSIEVGKRADMVLLDLNKPHCIPGNNLYSRIVFSARSTDVDTVIVDGKVVVKNGEWLTLDVQRILQEAQEELAKLLRRVGFA